MFFNLFSVPCHQLLCNLYIYPLKNLSPCCWLYWLVCLVKQQITELYWEICIFPILLPFTFAPLFQLNKQTNISTTFLLSSILYAIRSKQSPPNFVKAVEAPKHSLEKSTFIVANHFATLFCWYSIGLYGFWNKNGLFTIEVVPIETPQLNLNKNCVSVTWNRVLRLCAASTSQRWLLLTKSSEVMESLVF